MGFSNFHKNSGGHDTLEKTPERRHRCLQRCPQDLQRGLWNYFQPLTFHSRSVSLRRHTSHQLTHKDDLPPTFYDSTIDKYCKKKSHQQSLLVRFPCFSLHVSGLFGQRWPKEQQIPHATFGSSSLPFIFSRRDYFDVQT